MGMPRLGSLLELEVLVAEGLMCRAWRYQDTVLLRVGHALPIRA